MPLTGAQTRVRITEEMNDWSPDPDTRWRFWLTTDRGPTTVTGLRLDIEKTDEAMNDLALLVTGVYGKPALPQNGAPLRLAVPWKLAYAYNLLKVEQAKIDCDVGNATLSGEIALGADLPRLLSRPGYRLSGEVGLVDVDPADRDPLVRAAVLRVRRRAGERRAGACTRVVPDEARARGVLDGAAGGGVAATRSRIGRMLMLCA